MELCRSYAAWIYPGNQLLQRLGNSVASGNYGIMREMQRFGNSLAIGNNGIIREMQRFGNTLAIGNYGISRELLPFQIEPFAAVKGHNFKMYTFMLQHTEEPRRGVIFVASNAPHPVSPGGAT